MDDPIREFAQEQLPRLKRELDAMLSERGSLDERIETRRRLIESLEKESALGSMKLFDSTSANGGAGTHADDKLATGEAIVRILAEHREPMARKEIFKALEERGWAPDGKNPKAAVGSALWYLQKTKVAAKVGTGWALRDLASADAKGNPPDAKSGGDAHED